MSEVEEAAIKAMQDKLDSLGGKHTAYGSYWIAKFMYDALDAAGLTIFWASQDLLQAMHIVTLMRSDGFKIVSSGGGSTPPFPDDITRAGTLGGEEEPRWAEADDVPQNEPRLLTPAESMHVYGEIVPSRTKIPVEDPRQWGDPPVEEPKPGCTRPNTGCNRPNKRKYLSKSSAISASKGLKERFGEGYDPLYPYECPAGGHWHLSHYRQGTAQCTRCTMRRPAWDGGRDWIMSPHKTLEGEPCSGRYGIGGVVS